MSVKVAVRAYIHYMHHHNVDILLSLSNLPSITVTESEKHTLENIKKCRTSEKGGRVLICPNCDSKIILYNPCNKRGCPICYRKNQIQWQKKAERRILPITHYHLTFSIPDSYTTLWLENKREVMESLFIATKEALQLVKKDSGLLVGSLLSFHSHGRGMCYKPHIHCALSGGGIDTDNKWKKLSNIPIRYMEEVTEKVFSRELKIRIQAKDLIIPKKEKPKQYRIYVRIHEKNGNNIIQYLAKSRNGVVIDMEQELKDVGDSIEFKENNNMGDCTTQLKKTTFIERYLNHIPLQGSVVTRYYGLYSNRHKADFDSAKVQVSEKEEKCEMPYKELCPKCKQEMVVLESISSADRQLFWRYGNEQGPPKHREILCFA
jgi:hypothetical protein